MGGVNMKPVSNLKSNAPLQCRTLEDGLIECKKFGTVPTVASAGVTFLTLKTQNTQSDTSPQETKYVISKPVIFRQQSDGSFLGQNADKITAATVEFGKDSVTLLVDSKLLVCKLIMRDPEGRAQVLYIPSRLAPAQEAKPQVFDGQSHLSGPSDIQEINGLSPVVTGPTLWEMVHCIPYVSGSRLTTEGVTKFLKRFGRGLTCGKCQEHYAENMRLNSTDSLYNVEYMQVWVCKLHNKINLFNKKSEWSLDRTSKYYVNVSKSVWRRALLNYLYFTFCIPGRREDYVAILDSLCVISPPDLDITVLLKKFQPDDKDNISKLYKQVESKLDNKTGWTLADRIAMIRAAML